MQIPQFVKEFSQNIASNLVATALVVAMSLLASFLAESWQVALFGGMVLITLGLICVNQIETSKHGPGRTSRRLTKNIRDWLEHGKYSILTNPQPKTTFRFDVTDQTKKTMSVIHPEGEPFILVKARMQFDSAGQKLFTDLGPERRIKLSRSLAVELVRFGVGFHNQLPTHIDLFHQIPYDETLTQAIFLERLMFFRGGILLVQAFLQQWLEEEIHVQQQTPPS